jgi:hypothetical protein
MTQQISLFMKDAAAFIKAWRKNPQKGHRMTQFVPESDRAAVMRRRSDFAKAMLESAPFQEACQFMNESIVEDIASCSILDKDKLTVLKLRLELVSEFPQVLAMFIDQYEELEVIRKQRENADRRAAEMEAG